MQTSDWKAASDCEQIDIFSIPILRGILRDMDLEQVQSDCRSLVAEAKELHNDDESKNYTSYFDEELRQKLILLPWYKEFAEQVKDTYIQFIQVCYGQSVGHIKRNDLHLFAWVNVYNKEHSHSSHNHINSYMSGTWYPSIQDEDTQPIQFRNPNPAFAHALNLPTNDWSKPEYDNAKFVGGPCYHDMIEFFPRTNEFLLWPSMLMHEVPKISNTEPEYERISISFNLHHPVGVPNQGESTDDLEYGFLEQPVQEQQFVEREDMPVEKNLDLSRRERVLLDPLGASEKSDNRPKGGLLL